MKQSEGLYQLKVIDCLEGRKSFLFVLYSMMGLLELPRVAKSGNESIAVIAPENGTKQSM